MTPTRRTPDWAPILVASVGVLFVAVLLVANPYEKALQNQLLGLALMLAGGSPIVQWAQRPETNPLPVMQITGLFYAICYGFAGLVTPDRFMGGIVVTEGQYTIGLIGAIISLTCVYVAFRLGGRIPWPRTPAMYRIDDTNIDTMVLYIALPASVLIDQISTQLKIDLGALTNPIHDFFFVWVFYAALKGRYPRLVRLITFFVVTPIYLALYLNITKGRLAGLLTIAFLIGLTYIAGRKKVPLLALVGLLSLFFVLQPVKGYYREITWGRQQDLSAVEGMATFAKLANEQYIGENAKPLESNLNDAYSRINHLQTASAIIAATPDVVNFRNGVTYLPLLTKWIPRAIWPDKPREDQGNSWAHDYRYVGENDYSTSFNLPWYPEMYMNFGWPGVVIISGLIGLLMSAIWNIVAKGATVPSQFAAGMMFCSVFYFPESNLSIEIGNLLIMLGALSGICWALWAISQRRLLRPASRLRRTLRNRAVTPSA